MDMILRPIYRRRTQDRGIGVILFGFGTFFPDCASPDPGTRLHHLEIGAILPVGLVRKP